MTAINLKHFDTLGYVEKSVKLGVSEEVAKFQARELEAMFDLTVSNSNQQLEKELDNVATKADIQNLRFELLKWVVGVGATTVIAISGIMFTLLKLMH